MNYIWHLNPDLLGHRDCCMFKLFAESQPQQINIIEQEPEIDFVEDSAIFIKRGWQTDERRTAFIDQTDSLWTGGLGNYSISIGFKKIINTFGSDLVASALCKEWVGLHRVHLPQNKPKVLYFSLNNPYWHIIDLLYNVHSLTAEYVENTKDKETFNNFEFYDLSGHNGEKILNYIDSRLFEEYDELKNEIEMFENVDDKNSDPYNTGDDRKYDTGLVIIDNLFDLLRKVDNDGYKVLDYLNKWAQINGLHIHLIAKGLNNDLPSNYPTTDEFFAACVPYIPECILESAEFILHADGAVNDDAVKQL